MNKDHGVKAIEALIASQPAVTEVKDDQVIRIRGKKLNVVYYRELLSIGYGHFDGVVLLDRV